MQSDAGKFSPDGSRVLRSSFNPNDKTMGRQVVNVESQSPVGTQLANSDRHQFQGFNFSDDNKRLVGQAFDKSIGVWDARTGMSTGELKTGHESLIWNVVVSPDGKRAISISQDKTARLWDLHTNMEFGDPMKHQGNVRSVAFSSDGFASRDGIGGRHCSIVEWPDGCSLGRTNAP